MKVPWYLQKISSLLFYSGILNVSNFFFELRRRTEKWTLNNRNSCEQRWRDQIRIYADIPIIIPVGQLRWFWRVTLTLLYIQQDSVRASQLRIQLPRRSVKTLKVVRNIFKQKWVILEEYKYPSPSLSMEATVLSNTWGLRRDNLDTSRFLSRDFDRIVFFSFICYKIRSIKLYFT